MKILIELPELSAEAYKLMAKDFGRSSRQELILEILQLQLDKFPQYLHRARPQVAVKQAIRSYREGKDRKSFLSPMTEQDYRDILGDDFDQYKDQLTFAKASRENLAVFPRTVLSPLEEKVLSEILLEMPELLEPEPKKEEPAAPELGMFPQEGGTEPELPEM